MFWHQVSSGFAQSASALERNVEARKPCVIAVQLGCRCHIWYIHMAVMSSISSQRSFNSCESFSVEADFNKTECFIPRGSALLLSLLFLLELSAHVSASAELHLQNSTCWWTKIKQVKAASPVSILRGSSEWLICCPLTGETKIKEHEHTEKTLVLRQSRELCWTCISQLNSLRVERLITPLCSPHQPNTHTSLQLRRWHTHTRSYTQCWGMLGKIALIYYCHTRPRRFNGCAAKARLPPPMSHNYLLTAQTNRATQRVTSNQNCHRWLSPVIKSARLLPVRRVREWKEEGECDRGFIIDP